MRPFVFGANPPNDDDRYEFDFVSPVTPNLYRLDIQMPVPMQPWHGIVLPPESNASASGSSFQLQESLINANNRQDDIPPQLPSSSPTNFQPQQSLVSINNFHYDIYQQLCSNYGPNASSYLASSAHHPIPNERQPIGSFFPDFSQAVPSMDNDVLLPIGAEYRDELHRECVFGVEGTPGEMSSRKHKGHSNTPQTEYIGQPLQKRARLRKSIANTLTMTLTDAEPSTIPFWPQLVASTPSFGPPEAGPSMCSSWSVVLHPPSASLGSIPFTVPSQSVISQHLSAPFNPQPSMVPSQSVILQPLSAPFNSQSFTVPSLPVAAPAVPCHDVSELPYNPANPVHKKIILCALKAIKTHLINTQSISTQLERKQWIAKRLQELASQQYGDPEFGHWWASSNSTTLYMTLSDPCKTLMHMCKRLACSKVILYGLHPGVWSTANKYQFRASRIAELLSKETFLPRFTFSKDESGNLHFLEDNVVWEVVLDVIMELNLHCHLVNLDSLFCLAAAAVSCTLNKLKTNQFTPIEFTAEGFQELYNNLLKHLRLISSDLVFLARWTEYKNLTLARLTQIYHDL